MYQQAKKSLVHCLPNVTPLISMMMIVLLSAHYSKQLPSIIVLEGLCMRATCVHATYAQLLIFYAFSTNIHQRHS